MKRVWYVIIMMIVLIGIIAYIKNLKMSYENSSEKFFNENIIELVKQNSFYRKEIITGLHSQVVIMSIPAGEDIGEEIHEVDQTFFFVEGRGQAIINDIASDIYQNYLLFVPARTRHNIKNSGSESLKLFTIYAPAQHKPGTVEEIKKEE